jgi:hypothetical protein
MYKKGGYLDPYPYNIHPRSKFADSTTVTATATTSFIYYVIINISKLNFMIISLRTKSKLNKKHSLKRV